MLVHLFRESDRRLYNTVAGRPADINEEVARSLITVGVARAVELEAAVVEPPEVATLHRGGGWYVLPDGQRVKGKRAAERALRKGSLEAR